MIGTEGYAPPEQYKGVADARGDIYALGATFHHLVTGSDPRSETPFTFTQRPPRKSIPLCPNSKSSFAMRLLQPGGPTADSRRHPAHPGADQVRARAEVELSPSPKPVGQCRRWLHLNESGRGVPCAR